MYNRSGTDERCFMGAGTLGFHSSVGSTLLREKMSGPPSWKCDVKSKIRLNQSMRILSKKNIAKFHPDPIWNNGALGFLEEVPKKNKKKNNNKMS